MHNPTTIKHWLLAIDAISNDDVTFLSKVGCRVSIEQEKHEVNTYGQTFHVAGKRAIKITTYDDAQVTMLLLKFGVNLMFLQSVTYDSILIENY